MILTGLEIKNEVEKNKILIDPFDERNINPNSYNFHLDNTLKIYTDKILDPKKKLNTKDIIIPEEGLLLKRNKLYLGSTIEIMGSNSYIPMIFGRSSIGRLGLFIHITAPLGDIGFHGKWTLQLHVTEPVVVYPGLRLGQIMFFKPLGEISLYDGKYKNSRFPRKSEIKNDFE